MSIPLGVLTNKITHKVQSSKLTYLQPILTFVHSNLCPIAPFPQLHKYLDIFIFCLSEVHTNGVMGWWCFSRCINFDYVLGSIMINEPSSVFLLSSDS
jgi:hypothetical protein